MIFYCFRVNFFRDFNFDGKEPLDEEELDMDDDLDPDDEEDFRNRQSIPESLLGEDEEDEIEQEASRVEL